MEVAIGHIRMLSSGRTGLQRNICTRGQGDNISTYSGATNVLPLHRHQLDVNSAFLYTDFDEDIEDMEIPNR